MIEPRFELIGHLASISVIDYKDVAKLQAMNSAYERNTALMNILLNKPDEVFRSFLNSLEATGQKHVVIFITSSGGWFRCCCGTMID